MRVVIAPDSFGGTLTAREAAAALAEGWHAERPDDEVVVVPMSDGGEGLLDVVHTGHDIAVTGEVCGPLGLPTDGWVSLRADGTAVIESAVACGLALVPDDRRTPMRTTTYGVGELIDLAVSAGATRILVGLGGSSTVDGGAGALTGLGFRLRVADGSGLKIGGADLGRVASVERGWAQVDDDLEVELLADVEDTLDQAAPVYGPQKGATPDDVAALEQALATWADVAERDFDRPGTREVPGSGAAGGLGFGLMVGLGAVMTPGARRVADLVGLDDALDGAGLVLTGEGRLDATSTRGKVVGEVLRRAGARGVPVRAVVGGGLDHVPGIEQVVHAPGTDTDTAMAALTAAARQMAAHA